MGYPAPRQGNIPWLVVNTRAGSHWGDLCSVFGDCVHCELYIVSHGWCTGGVWGHLRSIFRPPHQFQHLSSLGDRKWIGLCTQLSLRGGDWRQNLREVIIFKFCKRHKVPREGIFHHFFEEWFFSESLDCQPHAPRFELIFLLVWVLIVVNHAVALFSALSHCIRNFSGSGAFFWRRESWWKSGGGFLALSPPLPTPIMGFFGLRWGEKVPGRDFMLQPSQIKLKYVGSARGTPPNQERALNLSILPVSGPGEVSRVESN